MVFDYNNTCETLRNNGEEFCFSTITDEFAECAQALECDGHTFRNFDTLSFGEHIHITNCVFENCRSITIDTGIVKNCSFCNSSLIILRDTEVFQSTFKDSVSDVDTLISLEDSKIWYSSFNNLKLLNDSYLCDGVGDSWIESCCFDQISTSRQDGCIINCEETVGKLFKKTKKFCIVDESSCKGLEQVNIIGDFEPLELSIPETFTRYVEKGLLTNKQVEEIMNGQVGLECDLSAYNANLLAKPFVSLNLDIISFNCLTRAGFETIEDIVKLNVLEILGIRNIGKRSIVNVATRLKECGIVGSCWEFFL